MALDGFEWVIIIGGVAMLFLWSPQKLPELARALGQAKREFDKASREVYNAASTPPPVKEKTDDQLITTAKKLGISTDGKSKEEISQEIVDKAQTS